MGEIRNLVEELLKEMETLTVEEIEDIRESWSATIKGYGSDIWVKVGTLVNAVCDCGVSRAQKRRRITA